MCTTVAESTSFTKETSKKVPDALDKQEKLFVQLQQSSPSSAVAVAVNIKEYIVSVPSSAARLGYHFLLPFCFS